MEFVWMRHEFPSLRHGPVVALADADADRFTEALRELGFEVVMVNGNLIRDEPSFWAEMKAAFGFPEYQGTNWDAFDDSFGEQQHEAHLAIVWRRADLIAAADLKLLADGIAVLCTTRDREARETQLVIVLTGEGSTFPPMG